MAQRKIMISACLAGVNCVYDGTNNHHPFFAHLWDQGRAVLFCPEALGGLKVPHPPSEVVGGDGFSVIKGEAKVFSKEGKDVTAHFIRGAKKSLALAESHGIKKAVMKSKSPSCGSGLIFDGTFTKKLVSGYGVAAAFLKQAGVEVVSDVVYLEEQKGRRCDDGKRGCGCGENKE